ncbi:tRNA pseudouridine(38-40) synthase TruA [Fluviicola sp. SGL-29]|nr:tRNA pseudouridine(38-40) synthase TruA [Fluviicola sp. SGL-29]
MRRYFFEIAYDGGAFYGWQIQPKQASVQETIEHALTQLNSRNPVAIVGCGRTDTGVHASSYIFHADLESVTSVEQLQYKLNKMLPATIAVHRIWEVDPELHARFSAVKRTYRYYIHTRKNPFKQAYSTYFPAELNVAKMNEAARSLIGIHDFTTFSKTNTDVKTHMCEVFNAHWEVTEEGYVFAYTANRFLRNMVRATVGTLLEVGLEKITPEDFKTIFESLDRNRCAGSAPAQGLYLSKVEY